MSTLETHTPKQIITGDYPVYTHPVTVENGQDLAEFSVVGRVTATGEYKLSAAAAGDGSEVPVGIMVAGVDATGGAAQGVVYMSGTFNPDLLVFGAGHDADTVEAATIGTPIFLRKPF